MSVLMRAKHYASLKEDQFKCKNGEGCVFTGWLCDGDADCGDHSDEHPEHCKGKRVVMR